MTGIRAIILLAAALLSCASAADAQRLMGAGEGEHGWLAVQQAWRGEDAWDLYHHPLTDDAAALQRVQSLHAKPERVIAAERSVLLVYPPEARGSGSDRRTIRPVRTVSAVIEAVGGVYRYEPSDRAAAMPHLPGTGYVVGGCGTGEGAAVLLRQFSASGWGRLLTRGARSSEWEEVPLPEGLERGARWRIFNVGGEVAIVEHGEGGATLWRRGQDGWRDEPIDARADDDALLAAGSQVVAARWASEDTLTLRLLRAGESYDLATVDGVPPEAALLPTGETVVAVWFDAENENRLRMAVVSAVSGEVLHQGFAGTAGPLGREDIQLLGLLMAGVVLTVLLFLLRPEAAMQREPVLPKGTALAEPGRRLAAALADMAVAAGLSALLWQAPFGAAVAPGEAAVDAFGFLPMLTSIGLFIAHSAVGEWLSGRTLGKFLVGARTVDATGRERLRLRQAVVRNSVKAIFPPLTILLLLDQARRHPGDQIASTLVVVPIRSAGEDGDSERSD